MLAGLVAVAKPRRLVRTLLDARVWWVLAAAPWPFAAVLLDSLRLYWLMRPHGYRQGWWAVLRTNLVVNFVSLFLPGTIGGGAVAWYRLARPDRLHAQTFTALSFSTLLKVAAMSAVGAAALALDAGETARFRSLIAPLILLAAAPLGVLFLLLFTGLSRWARLWLDRRLWLPSRLREAGGKLLESAETYRAHRPAIAGVLLAGVGRILISVPGTLFCLYAFRVEGVGYVRLLWIKCAVEASGMLPFTLSGWGLPQVTFVGLLAAFGVGAASALAANIASWAALLPMLLTGAGVMLWESLRRGARTEPAAPPGAGGMS